MEVKDNDIMKNFMNIQDLKIWGLSSFALTMNLMDVKSGLSIVLTLTAIGYTLHKWYIMYNKNKNK